MNKDGKLLFFDAPASRSATQEIPPVPPSEEALAILTCLLRVEGFNPVTQLAGYLITEDPTYLPEDTTARALARRVGRDKLLEALIESYLDTHICPPIEEPVAEPDSEALTSPSEKP